MCETRLPQGEFGGFPPLQPDIPPVSVAEEQLQLGPFEGFAPSILTAPARSFAVASVGRGGGHPYR
jgi:hypothetical protein